jgi:hypothetical protein
MNELWRVAIRDACRIYNKLPDVAASTVDGDGIRFFYTFAANTICIRPRFSDGTRATYVMAEDVCLLVTGSDACHQTVHVHTQIRPDSESDNAGMYIAYTLDADAGPVLKEIRVRIRVCGVLLVDTVVVRKFDGRTDGQLHI